MTTLEDALGYKSCLRYPICEIRIVDGMVKGTHIKDIYCNLEYSDCPKKTDTKGYFTPDCLISVLEI